MDILCMYSTAKKLLQSAWERKDMFEYSDCKNFEFHTVVMAGNASKCCWPHRKQEMKLHSTTIISKYLTLIALFAGKSGGGGAGCLCDHLCHICDVHYLWFRARERVLSIWTKFQFVVCIQGQAKIATSRPSSIFSNSYQNVAWTFASDTICMCVEWSLNVGWILEKRRNNVSSNHSSNVGLNITTFVREHVHIKSITTKRLANYVSTLQLRVCLLG